MRIYFLSEKLAALSVNGLFLGSVDGFERTLELDPKDGYFLECKPVGGFRPTHVRFDEDFLIDPPPQAEVYHTRGGAAVFFKDFVREDASMHVLWQENLLGVRLTLFVQGRVQLCMQSAAGFALVDLPDEFEGAKIAPAGEYFLLEGENAFCILTRTGEKVALSAGKITERGERVVAETPLPSSLGHTAVRTWERGKLVSCTLRTKQQPTEAFYGLALFESVLAGADPAPFLAEELVEKAAALKEFLGDFSAVIPCENQDEVGLVYKRHERVFDVRYFRVILSNGKIANIEEV